MKLITERIEQVQYITEASENGKKNLYITGPFLVYDKPNKNNRLYTKDTLSKEVGRYNEEFVRTNRALGELGHPDTPSINLERVSHKIVSLEDNGEAFIGKAMILETPYGQIVKNFIDSGVNLGVSSRGMGSLTQTKEGYNLVQDDFKLATAADIVADPSAPDAFVQGIMEGVEWIWNNGVLEQKVANFEKKINTYVDQGILEQYKLSLFNEFLNSL